MTRPPPPPPPNLVALQTLAVEMFARRAREIRGPQSRGGEGSGPAGAAGSLTTRRFRFPPGRGSKRRQGTSSPRASFLHTRPGREDGRNAPELPDSRGPGSAAAAGSGGDAREEPAGWLDRAPTWERGALTARGRAGARRCSGAARGRPGRAGLPSWPWAAGFLPQGAGRRAFGSAPASSPAS